MSNPRSSDVVFSGYFPIEVTASDFERTIEDDGVGSSSERKKSTSQKSMTRRFGNLLSSSRKKRNPGSIGNGNDNDRNSLSGISNHGQQSVANKTVDSGATMKASNIHQDEGKMARDQIFSKLHGTDNTKTSVAIDIDTKRQQSATLSNKRYTRPTKPWKSLKRLVGKGRSSKEEDQSITSQESSDREFLVKRHTKSHDGGILLGLVPSSSFLNNAYPMRKRFYSEGADTTDQKQKQQKSGAKSFSGAISYSSESQHAIDQVIRGRLDGIDVLSLGPACRASLPAKVSKQSSKGENLFFDPLYPSFTNIHCSISPANLVEEMIWTSAGLEQPEIIFEGFYPGGHDRWGVRVASEPSLAPLEKKTTTSISLSSMDKKSFSPLPTLDLEVDEDDESTAVSSSHTSPTHVEEGTNLPITELWNSIWGLVNTPPPIPSHMNTKRMTTTLTNDDPEDRIINEEEEVLKLVETCNVPIDLDDDAFMIDGPKHLQTVHELVMVPLQSRRFQSAISIFEKLLRGLEGNNKLHHLIGSTSHNIGLIQLCQGSYQKALKSFEKAVEVRKEFLPCDHPDIAVSLQRKGMAHFALSSITEALQCFEAALAICTPVDNTRAKILNNIGVARYQLQDYGQALKSFTSALEIQRPWLEGPIRRDSVVYSASIILSNMGKVYLRNGDHDLAYFVFEEACLMQTLTFRNDHDIVLQSLDNMARAHAKNGNYAEALRIFTSLYRSQESRFGRNSAVCIETTGMMGMAHWKLLEYEEAESCMKKVEGWQNIQGMDESHPSVQITNKQMDQIKRCLQGKEPMWV